MEMVLDKLQNFCQRLDRMLGEAPPAEIAPKEKGPEPEMKEEEEVKEFLKTMQNASVDEFMKAAQEKLSPSMNSKIPLTDIGRTEEDAQHLQQLIEMITTIKPQDGAEWRKVRESAASISAVLKNLLPMLKSEEQRSFTPLCIFPRLQR